MIEQRIASPSSTLIWLAVAAVLLTFVVAHTLMGASNGWYVPLNDFWPQRFFAERMSLTDPKTLSNGFYPVGAFLWTLWPSEPTRTLVIANLAVTCAVTVCAGLVAAHRTTTGAALIVTAIITSDPRWNHYVGAQTADIIAASVFGLGGALLLESASTSRPARVAAMAGSLLGLAATTRYHFGPAGVLLLGSWALVAGYRRPAAVAALAFAPLPIAQAILNRAAGVSMARTQLFNVNKTINDIDWYAAADIELPESLLQLLLADPARSIRQVAWMVGDSAPWAAACVAAALLAKDTKCRRALAAIAVFAALYVCVTALGSSHRSALALVPITAISGAIAIAEQLPRLTRAARTALAVSLVVLISAPTVGATWRTHTERSRHAIELRAVADAVRSETGIDDAKRVFSTDVAGYLPGLSTAFPNIPAGWQRFGMHGFRAEYPDICVDTPECFVADLRAADIRVVLLNPQARHVSPALEALRALRVHVDGLTPIGSVGPTTVFSVAAPPAPAAPHEAEGSGP
jgi:hypothetical protein